MDQEKVGQKPDQEGGAGLGKDQAGMEVGARGGFGPFVCFSCGQTNYCAESWEWFTCAFCNVLNYTSPGLPR